MRITKNRSKKAGLEPGTLVHIGDKKTEKTKIEIIEYSKNSATHIDAKKVEECFSRNKKGITWINIEGIHDVELIGKLGRYFGLHPLLLEDIANASQRPKIEDFGKYIFLVLKMISYDNAKNGLVVEQVSFVLGSSYVISFQEGIEGDVFNPVRERIKSKGTKLRENGADYLLYSLIDAVVDNYFGVLEKIEDRIEDVEEELLTTPGSSTLRSIHKLKREMTFLLKAVWPLREAINSLERRESALIGQTTSVYLRDVYDHLIQVIDTLETLRDILSGMLEVYLSNISNKLNEIMKVLTIITTIFIPLTFIAGVYGMNFRHMPELDWIYGYPVALVVMLFIALIMVVYFKNKKWM